MNNTRHPEANDHDDKIAQKIMFVSFYNTSTYLLSLCPPEQRSGLIRTIANDHCLGLFVYLFSNKRMSEIHLHWCVNESKLLIRSNDWFFFSIFINNLLYSFVLGLPEEFFKRNHNNSSSGLVKNAGCACSDYYLYHSSP